MSCVFSHSKFLFPVFCQKQLIAGSVLVDIKMEHRVLLAIGLEGSIASAEIKLPFTEDIIFDINKNNFVVGSIVFKAGNTSGVFIKHVDTIFFVGDGLSIKSPAIISSNITNINFLLIGQYID